MGCSFHSNISSFSFLGFTFVLGCVNVQLSRAAADAAELLSKSALKKAQKVTVYFHVISLLIAHSVSIVTFCSLYLPLCLSRPCGSFLVRSLTFAFLRRDAPSINLPLQLSCASAHAPSTLCRAQFETSPLSNFHHPTLSTFLFRSSSWWRSKPRSMPSSRRMRPRRASPPRTSSHRLPPCSRNSK